MCKILVTGANGQLGNELRILASEYPAFKFYFTDVDKLNISDNHQLQEFVAENPVDFILNCAAYTAVDKAESDEGTAWKINTEAVRNLAYLAAEQQIKLIHVSTDYVFDGMNHLPYKEEDSTKPSSVYGQTKFEGEKEIWNTRAKAIVIRTSWLYSSFGNNFVKTMLKASLEKDVLRVVWDQVGTPTYAADLAQAILSIVELSHREPQRFVTGTYHYSNEGVTSWYDFALEILHQGKRSCKVVPIETRDYPTAAKRPPYSVLNKWKIKHTFGITIPHWKESLKHCIELINKRKTNN